MKINEAEIYEGNNAPVIESIHVNEVYSEEDDSCQTRIEIANTVIYLTPVQTQVFIHMLENQ